MADNILLPKTVSEYKTAQFWDSFFEKRDGRAFDWYGEYGTLCGVLHKYMRPSEKTLVVGCGNSPLSEDLYDVGYHNMINVDIADNVIKHMAKKNAKDRPKMTFEVMDTSDMTYEDSSFSVVLDKAMLDAILTDVKEDTLTFVRKVFAEFGRVLKVGGRYICVTLAQEHVITELMDYFSSEGWMLRIHMIDMPKRGESHETLCISPLPVFVVICTKFRKMEGDHKPIFEVSLSEARKPERMETQDDVLKAMQEQQDYAMLQHNLNKSSVCDLPVCVDLYAVGDNVNPRFSLHVVDKPKGKVPSNRFAIFIVPQGRETEFMFGTDKGRRQLADQAGFERLLVVTLHRGHKYESVHSIKSELSAKVMELAPAGLPAHTQVPFLSIGQDVGEREVKLEEMATDGKYKVIVEDVRGEDNALFRQMIFSSNLGVIQSQAKLITERPRSKTGKKKGKPITRIDHLHLSMTFHRLMIAGLALIPDCLDLLKTGARGLVVGLGGGGLPMYLYKQYPKLYLDVVELDPMVRDVAKNWFGLVEDKRLRVHVEDGLDFIKSAVEKDKPPIYNFIMFDVDSKDTSVGVTGPPKAFLESEVLERVKQLLHPTQGVFILNLACRNEELKKSVLSDIRSHFPSVHVSLSEGDINEIVYCLPVESSDSADKLKARYRDGARALQKYTKSVSTCCCSGFDLCEIMDDLLINDER